jgi:hypothetical protein
MTEFKLRDESWALAQALVGFGVVMLVAIGITGMIYRVIAPDGWIAEAFSRSLSAGLTTLVTLGVIGALVWLNGPTPHGKYSTSIEIVVLGIAGAGALFLLQAGLNSML